MPRSRVDVDSRDRGRWSRSVASRCSGVVSRRRCMSRVSRVEVYVWYIYVFFFIFFLFLDGKNTTRILKTFFFFFVFYQLRGLVLSSYRRRDLPLFGRGNLPSGRETMTEKANEDAVGQRENRHQTHVGIQGSTTSTRTARD